MLIQVKNELVLNNVDDKLHIKPALSQIDHDEYPEQCNPFSFEIEEPAISSYDSISLGLRRGRISKITQISIFDVLFRQFPFYYRNRNKKNEYLINCPGQQILYSMRRADRILRSACDDEVDDYEINQYLVYSYTHIYISRTYIFIDNQFHFETANNYCAQFRRNK